MPTIQLLIGLANPGKEYAATRHNAGAWFIDQLAKNCHVTLKPEAKFHSLHTQVMLHHQPCHLLIPTTFMNHSGRAVRAFMHYHKIVPENILIAHDDIDLPVGTIKLKFAGGDGGHNGLKDIISQLSSKEFYRLRVGVGHPGNRTEVVDYVLSPPGKLDRQKINDALIKAETVLPLIVSGHLQQAMHQLHTDH